MGITTVRRSPSSQPIVRLIHFLDEIINFSLNPGAKFC